MAETPADTFNEEFFEGFEVCLKEAISLPAFVKEFNRLSGCQLGIDDRKPIERMIDESTGYQKVLSEKQEEYMRQFAFLYGM